MKKDNEPLTNPATEHLNSQMPLDDRGPLDLERQIDELTAENSKLKQEIIELKGQVQDARNDADNQRALANIPRY